MLRALTKSGPELLKTLDETSVISSTDGTKEKLKTLIESARGCGETFDEKSMFLGSSAEVSFSCVFFLHFFEKIWKKRR